MSRRPRSGTDSDVACSPIILLIQRKSSRCSGTSIQIPLTATESIASTRSAIGDHTTPMPGAERAAMCSPARLWMTTPSSKSRRLKSRCVC